MRRSPASGGESEELRTRPTLLAGLAAAANEDAWVRFYEVYQGVILGMARRWGVSETAAWDVLQEVMLAVNRIAHSFSYDAKRRIFIANSSKGSSARGETRGGFRQWLFVVVKRAIWKERYAISREREVLFADLAADDDGSALRDYPEQVPSPEPAPDAVAEAKAQQDYRLALLEQAIRLLPDCSKRSHPRKLAIFLALKQPHVFDSIMRMDSPPLPPKHLLELQALHRLKEAHQGDLSKQAVMEHYAMSSNHVDQEVKAIKSKLAAIFVDLRAGRDPRES